MRHCVHLEILLGNESEFSKIGVRMREIWPLEVSRIFGIRNSSEIRIQIRIQDPEAGWAGKFPPRAQIDHRVDLGVDLPLRADLFNDLLVTRCRLIRVSDLLWLAGINSGLIGRPKLILNSIKRHVDSNPKIKSKLDQWPSCCHSKP